MKAIKITYLNETNLNIELDILALISVLRNPNYANYPVAIYSIAGPYRSGKSFLQNLLIHYIQSSQVCIIPLIYTWLFFNAKTSRSSQFDLFGVLYFTLANRVVLSLLIFF